MEPYLIWLLVGFGLAIVELLTGTFYLLMLGIAAFGGAAVAFVGQPFAAQIIIAAAIAAAGCYAIHLYRAKSAAHKMRSIDAGQPASFENWVDEAAGLARVRYRGASWDARVDANVAMDGASAVGAVPLVPGELLYVVAAESNTLRVSRQRPL